MNELEEYSLRWRGRETGPFSLAEINRQLDEHEIGMGHEIFYRNQWITLEEFFQPEIETPVPEPATMEAAPLPEERPLPIPIAAASGEKARNRLVFGLLAVFIGFSGAHNFYARQWLTGMLQLLLSVATYLLGFGIIAAWIWAVVEAFTIRKDGDGIEMT